MFTRKGLTFFSFVSKNEKSPSKDAYFGQGKQCHVAGWGALYSGDIHGPSILQEVDITLMSEDYCVANSHMDYSNLDDSMFCAGTLDNDGNGLTDGLKDSCQGDSGGPVICAENGVPFLSGVVSWGNGCAGEGYPGVYADVSSVKDWAMGFFDDYDIPCYSEVAYNPQMELYLCDISDMDISEGHVIGFR